MANTAAILKRISQLEDPHPDDIPYGMTEIYWGLPEDENPQLIWRHEKTYQKVFEHHGDGNAAAGYKLFQRAAKVTLPETWLEYAETIHAGTINLFSQFLKPIEGNL